MKIYHKHCDKNSTVNYITTSFKASNIYLKN